MKVEKTYTSIIITLLLALTAVLQSGCTDTRVTPDMFDPDQLSEESLIPIVLNLKGLFGPENSPETYAYTPTGDQPGYGDENRIDDVTVYIFKSNGTCEKIMLVHNLSALRSDTVLVMSGNKTIVAVANKVNFASLPGPGSESSVNYASLRTLMTQPLTHLPKPPFLMTGEKSVYLDGDKPYTNPNEVEINLERAVAKVKVFVNKTGLAANHALYLNQVSLRHGADRAGLLQTSGTVLYPLDSVVTANAVTPYHFNPSYATASPNGNIPTLLSGNWCQLVDTFYTYESLCGADTAKGVRLDFRVGVNSPTNYRYASVYLAQNPRTGLPGDTVYDIRRNYWYNVYVTINDPGMDSVYLTVKACPWNVADTQKITMGGGYEAETALPFRLVKPYDFDLSSVPTAYNPFAAIRKHSKGASWLKLQVTPDTQWKLSFTSSTGNNADAMMSMDKGASWGSSLQDLSASPVPPSDTIFIYRPYKENNEPDKGPTLRLELGNPLTTVREFQVGPRDTVPFPTNCYILRPQLTGAPANETRTYIPLAPVYRMWEDYFLRNGDTIPSGNITASLVWQDRAGNIINNYSTLSTTGVINPSKRDSAYLYVEAGTVQGNAVVAMQVNGVTYWSYHIWVTDYDPYQAAGQKYWQTKAGNKDSANVFMDRNLGALLNYYDPNGEARGLFYQSGRKDPFPRSQDWTNTIIYYTNPTTSVTPSPPNQLPVYATQSKSSSVLRPLAAIPYTLHNPFNFLNMAGTPGGWQPFYEDRYLWSSPKGNKTAYDPCPEGWRIPRQDNVNEWYSPWYGLQSDTVFVNNVNATYLFGRYHSGVGYYPYSGAYDSGGGMSFAPPDSIGWYQTSFLAGNSFNEKMYINDASSYGSKLNAQVANNWGISVRCVVDRNYLRNNNGGKFVQGNYLQLKNELLP